MHAHAPAEPDPELQALNESAVAASKEEAVSFASLSLMQPEAAAAAGHVRWARRRSANAAASSDARAAPRAAGPAGDAGACAADEADDAVPVPAEETPAKPAPGGGRLLATAGALLLVAAGPVASAALAFGMPFGALRHPVARAFAFAPLGSAGAALNLSVWIALFFRVPLRRIAPTYVPLFLVINTSLFAALSALVNLDNVPFAYLSCPAIIVLSNQICFRIHARAYARRALHPAAYIGAGPPAPAPDPARAIALVGKFQATHLLLVFILCVYLFVFSFARTGFLQVLVNAANSFVCFLLAFFCLRAFGRPLAAALPHGDAAIICILTILLSVRVFRQLSFFRVQSGYVYLASLAADLAALLVPPSLLLHLARPLVRRAPFLLRLVFADPPSPPEPEAPVLPVPSPAPSGSADDAAPSVEVRPLDGEGEEAPEELDGARWVFSARTGVRSMLLWHALASWTAAAVFSAVLLVARWGPGAAFFPYSPATFDDAACSSALFFSLATAGVHALVVAAFHVAARFSPRLRDRLGLAASWRFLRKRAPTLALTFSSCSALAFMCFVRFANIYSFVFPESYPPAGPTP